MKQTISVESQKPGLLRATGAVSFALAIGYFFSFAKAAIVAAYLGVGWQMDVFLWAYAIVDLVTMTISGPLDGAFIPVFASLKNEDEQDALKFTGAVLGLLSSLLMGLLLILIVFAPQIPAWLLGVNSFEQNRLATVLLWLMAPRILFMGLWSVYSASLSAEKNFFLPTLSNSVQTLFVVAALLVTDQKWAVYANAVGISFGTLLQFIFLVPVIRKLGWRIPWSLSFGIPGVVKFFNLFWPLILTRALILSLPVIDRTIASSFAQGSISALGYSQTLMQMSVLLFLSALQKSILPYLSQEKVQYGLSALARLFTSIIRGVFIVFMPLCVLLLVLKEPIIRLVLERGMFDNIATQLTIPPYAMYLLGVVPTALTYVSAYTFLALEDVRTNAWVGTVFLFLMKLLLNWVFTVIFGYSGLALATSGAYLSTAVVMMFILWRRGIFLVDKTFISGTLKGGMLLSIIVLFLANAGLVLVNNNIFLQLLMAGTLSLAGFYLFGLLLKVDEVLYIRQVISRYLPYSVN